jgi:hypothetical protein
MIPPNVYPMKPDAPLTKKKIFVCQKCGHEIVTTLDIPRKCNVCGTTRPDLAGPPLRGRPRKMKPDAPKRPRGRPVGWRKHKLEEES